MPRLSPKRTEQRLAQILSAALICFAEHGFHRTTMQDVATAASLSIGSLYCHFAGKDEVIHAVIAARHRRDLEKIEHAKTAPSLADALNILVAAFFPPNPTQEDRAWQRLDVQLWAEAHHDPALLGMVRAGMHHPMQVLGDLFSAAQLRGELSAAAAPQAAARTLIATFQGITLQQSWGETIDAPSIAALVTKSLAPHA